MMKLILSVVVVACAIGLDHPCFAAVEGITGVQYLSAPSDNLITNTAVISSFTTAQGTVSSLSHAVSASGNFQRSDLGSDIRNLWARDGAEIDGAQAVMNLDISTGAINVGGAANPGLMIDLGNTGGLTANFMFEQVINSGTGGLADDFFIFENGGNDSIEIVPLNSSGTPIGGFSLTINETDWGILPDSLSRVAEGVAPLTVSIGGVAFDLSDFTGSGTLMGVQGFAISGDEGFDPFVIGVNNALAPSPKPVLTVDRSSGAATLSNEGTVPLDLLGYQLTSEFGSLKPSNWLSIADEYDATSGGEVDNDDEWSELSKASDRDDLSEFAFGGPGNAGDGGVLAAGQSIPLSNVDGIWLPTHKEELTGVVVRLNGTMLPVTVLFTGNGDAPLLRSDLDSDGDIDELDWQTVNDNYRGDFSNLSLAEAYLAGDITGDSVNDLSDFLLFIADYDAFNGAGAFQVMLSGGTAVPEPSSFVVVCLLSGLIIIVRKPKVFAAALVCICFVNLERHAEAVIIAADNFESYDLGTDISDGGNGGFGWAGNWGQTTAPTTLEITDEPFTGAGRGLTITNTSSGDNNILFREFPVQTNDVYVGLSMRHDGPAGMDDFLHFYFNDTTASTPNNGIGGGVNRGSDQVGNYFVRIGGNGSDDVDVASTYGAAQTLVFKLSKGSGSSDYDQVSMWVDQTTEGTPNASLTSGQGNAEALPQLSTFHLRWTPLGGEGTLNLDNLVVATSYEDAISLALDPGQSFAMSATVNSVTGNVTLENNTSNPITFNSYELFSDGADTLNVAGWNSLASQSGIHPLINPVDGDDLGTTAGDGIGEAWTESGTPNAMAVAEQFLLGDTTLASGESIDLGQVYDTSVGGTFTGRYSEAGGLQRMEVQFFTPTVLDGDFDGDFDVDGADFLEWQRTNGTPAGLADWQGDYGNTNNLAATVAVPEPSAWFLMLCGLGTVLCVRRSVSNSVSVSIQCGVVLVAAVAGASVSEAAPTVVRSYSMGDNSSELASDNGTVGSTFGNPFDVLDDVDSDGEFQDLDDANGATYHQITASDLTQGHPGSTGTFGIEFNGTDDFLSVIALNAIGENTSQGLQMWVYPHQAGLGASRQSIVADSSGAGGPAITAGGFWTQSNSGHDNDNQLGADVPVVGDRWHHVAQHIYLGSDNAAPSIVSGTGSPLSATSVIYVNGIAVSGNNDNTGAAIEAFMVGASGDIFTPGNFFDGVMDELQVYTSEPNEFDLFSDNNYIKNVLIPGLPGGTVLAGDANLDGAVNAADATHFINNWRREKVLVGAHNSVYVGDWETRGWGDLDLNGRVDFDDAISLHAELIQAGVGGLNFALLSNFNVPEPSSVALTAMYLCALSIDRRAARRKQI